MSAIPKVSTCSVTSCCFNQSEQCHAAAIQVGSAHPACDTFTARSGGSCGFPDTEGGVGACKVESCSYNDRLMCTAPGIVVGMHDGHADCQTYRKR